MTLDKCIMEDMQLQISKMIVNSRLKNGAVVLIQQVISSSNLRMGQFFKGIIKELGSKSISALNQVLVIILFVTWSHLPLQPLHPHSRLEEEGKKRTESIRQLILPIFIRKTLAYLEATFQQISAYVSSLTYCTESGQ